MIKRDS